MSGENILVVDDDHGLLTLMRVRLEAAGYKAIVAEGAEQALSRDQDDPYDMAIIDLKLNGMNGMTLLEKLLLLHPHLPVIILTAHGSIASAVEATKKGAYDYLTKPFDPKDLLHRIEKALELRRLRGEVEQLRTLVRERYHPDNIVASSEKMQQVLRQVAQIAGTDSTICLYGETGTGKELIAKSIHAMSPRAREPFVAINCGAIPEGLLENELFGHVRGAYTGADQAQRGLLRQADRGTLFLDEIGELPQALQVKFLRVLQEREFYPLGAGQPIKADFRLIAATNQDLWEAVCSGRFREDLYYRIHVIPIVLPPLRERQEDIPLLAYHFLQRFAQAVHKGVKGFSAAAMQQLMVYTWPGNVRELANVVERSVVLATEELITPDLILLGRQPMRPDKSELLLFKDARAAFERAYLVQVLTATRGNISRAAEVSGRHRTEFYKLLRKYALDAAAFKDLPE
ncbi:MAG TPA: sigma-54 dependent transcriptional regulator [Candidatus Tectomicrobia bacterium]|nr:sigma-54 dependent transcriptional regulator [Candidatus Tectomicrobia bacterium]